MKIAFLSTADIDGGFDLVGGLLITDEDGYPVEVVCSDPIKLSTIEKISFGLSLKDKALVERVCVPLLGEVSAEPDFILIQQKFLSGLQNFTTIPIFCLEKAKNESGLWAQEEKKDNEIDFIHCNENIDVSDDIWEEFEKSFLFEDILEPFGRVDSLIQHVIKNGWNFSGEVS